MRDLFCMFKAVKQKIVPAVSEYFHIRVAELLEQFSAHCEHAADILEVAKQLRAHIRLEIRFYIAFAIRCNAIFIRVYKKRPEGIFLALSRIQKLHVLIHCLHTVIYILIPRFGSCRRKYKHIRVLFV